MEKIEAINLLAEKGYAPYEEDGSVMICTEDPKDIDRVGALLNLSGYCGSYGWKMEHR